MHSMIQRLSKISASNCSAVVNGAIHTRRLSAVHIQSHTAGSTQRVAINTTLKTLPAGSASVAAVAIPPAVFTPPIDYTSMLRIQAKARKLQGRAKSLLCHPDVDQRVWPLAGSLFMMGTAMGIVVPIIPTYMVQTLGMSQLQMGMVMSASGIARLFTNWPAAVVSERGRKLPLVLAPVVSGLSIAMIPFCGNVSHLLMARAVNGAAGAMQMASAQGYAVDISGPNNRSRTMVPTRVAWTSGMILGPAIGGILLDTCGPVAPFLITGALLGVTSYTNNKRLPETKRRNNGAGFMETIRSWGPLFRSSPGLQCCVAVQGTNFIITSGTMFAMLPQLATTVFHMSALQLGGVFALQGIVNMITSFFAAPIADKFGSKYIVVSGLMTASLAVAAISHWCSTPLQLAFCMALWGAANGTMGAGLSPYTVDVAGGGSDSRRAGALAILRMAMDVGLSAGALLLGTMSQITSVPTAMLMSAVLQMSVAVMFAIRAPRKAA